MKTRRTCAVARLPPTNWSDFLISSKIMHFLTIFLPIFFISLHFPPKTRACFGGGLGLGGYGCGGGFPFGGLGWGGGLFGADWALGGGYAAAPFLGTYAAAPYAAGRKKFRIFTPPGSSGFATSIYAPAAAAIISPCCPYGGMIGFRRRKRRGSVLPQVVAAISVNKTFSSTPKPEDEDSINF